jgi:hypothetical protein
VPYVGNQRATDTRAKWLVREWGRSWNAQGYDDGIESLRKRFGCGKTAAEQAYKRARALQREAMESIDAAWYVDRFIALADAARAKGEHAQAARIVAWMMDRTGHSAPAKLAIAARVQASVAPGSEPPHMKLLDETPAQRRQRMADLKARRALPAPVDASIEASATVVPQAQDGDPREDDGET